MKHVKCPNDGAPRSYCGLRFVVGHTATTLLFLLFLTGVTDSANAVILDPFDPRLGDTRRLRTEIEVFADPVPGSGVEPPMQDSGWLRPGDADARRGEFWYLEEELVWYRLEVSIPTTADTWLSVGIPGELVGVFAGDQPVPEPEQRHTLSFLSVTARTIADVEYLYLGIRRPLHHLRSVLAGPGPAHFDALKRYTGFRRNLLPPTAVEVAHFSDRRAETFDWHPLDARQLEGLGERSFAVRFSLPERFEGAAVSILHNIAPDGVELWVNGEPYYRWGDGVRTQDGPANAYRSPQLTVVTLPGRAASEIQIRRHYPTELALRKNIRDWQATIPPLGVSVGSAAEMILAQDRGWGFQQTHFVPAIVLAFVAVALLLLGSARSGRGKSTFFLLSGLVITGVGAYLGNQMDNVVLLLPGLRSLGYEASRVLYYISLFAVPPFLLFFFRSSTEVEVSRGEMIAGRALLVYSLLFGALQVITRGFFIPEGTLVWDMGPLGFLSYAVEWVVTIALTVVHARRSRDPQINRPLLVFALLLLCNGVFQVAAGAAPWFEMQVSTFVRVRALLFSASVIPLLAIPIVVYRRVEKGLEDANLVFRRFVPDEFLRFLGIEKLSDIRPGQQIETEMTVMFCDVRGFTSIAEGMEPADAMSFVNRYLEYVGPVIRKNGGFVDKYLGDGIMALFPGAPRGACRAASEIVKGITGLDGEVTVRVGIGLHTGMAMLGTVGEHDRMDTTVVSDAVNTASRLQALSARYGAAILASEETVTGAGEAVNYQRFVDRVRLKGKGRSITVHEIRAMPADEAEQKRDHRYRLAFDSLANGRLGEAEELLNDCLAEAGDDPVYALLARRLERFREQGLPGDWDGITSYATK